MTIRKLKRSTWAKIIIGAIVVLLLGLSPLYAEYEKPIGENDLPVNALTFLQKPNITTPSLQALCPNKSMNTSKRISPTR